MHPGLVDANNANTDVNTLRQYTYPPSSFTSSFLRLSHDRMHIMECTHDGMHKIECTQQNAYNGMRTAAFIRTMKSPQWSLYGIYTMEPVQWKLHDEIHSMESSRCGNLDGPDGHNSYDGYDSYNGYHLMKSA